MALDHFTVTRGTTKTVLNAQGVLETVPANVPAFEFNPDGSYKGCLIEPEATNLIPNSNELSSLITSTRTLNYGVSPDGTQNSFLIEFGSGLNNGVLLGVNIDEPLTTYTISFYARALETSTSNFFRVRLNPFDGPAQSFTIEATNEWERYEITFESEGIGTQSRLINGDEGVAGKEIEFFGFQLERSSVATSLIPTTGTTATRNADVIERTDASGLIGQEKGTIYLEGAWLGESVPEQSPAATGFKLGTSAGTLRGIAIGIGGDDNDKIRVQSRNVADTTNSSLIDYTLGDFVKIAVTYDYNGQAPNTTVTDGAKLYIDGVLESTFDLAVPDTGEELDEIRLLGGVSGSDSSTRLAPQVFKAFALYKRALTAQEIANL